MVNGVRPLAAIPTTTSLAVGFFRAIAFRPSSGESSAASTAAPNALGPPAITNCTIRGLMSNVGGHSTASRAAMRPLVPVPT